MRNAGKAGVIRNAGNKSDCATRAAVLALLRTIVGVEIVHNLVRLAWVKNGQGADFSPQREHLFNGHAPSGAITARFLFGAIHYAAATFFGRPPRRPLIRAAAVLAEDRALPPSAPN